MLKAQHLNPLVIR